MRSLQIVSHSKVYVNYFQRRTISCYSSSSPLLFVVVDNGDVLVLVTVVILLLGRENTS